MNFTAVILAILVLGVLGVVFGALLTFAAKKFYVETDERVEKVREHLAGANCGACGYAGCDAFAQAVVEGKASPDGCIPGGDTTAKAIGEVLGVKVTAKEQLVARVMCQGVEGISKERFTYDGYESCRVAASISGGPKMCRFACLGLGDCQKVCKFGAISLADGIASIDPKLCRGCGACVDECPRSVIALKHFEANVLVRCRNSDVARVARDVCMKACIGCGRCKRECEYDAIIVENGFARIDASKCTRCGKCAEVCPCNCITVSGE